MRISEACEIARAKIPQYTNELSDTAPATLSVANGICTINLPAHGLKANDKFTLSGFNVDNSGIDNEVINYSHIVQEVINADSFTFAIPQQFINITSENGTLHKNIRIHTALNVDLARSSYSKTNGEYKKVLYFIDLGVTSSRDRGVGNDASFQMTQATDFRISIMNKFGALAIMPIKNDLVGYSATDFTRELFEILLKSIVGRTLSSNFNNNRTSSISPISSNIEISNDAFVGQNYVFECVEQVGLADVNNDIFSYNINSIKAKVKP
jgi:hypothetical protein